MQIHIQDRNYYSSFIIDDELSDKDYVQKTNESFSEILKNNSLTKKQKINNSFDAQQLYKQANNINKNESESLANSTYNTQLYQEQIDKLNSKIVDRDKKIFKQDADIKALNEKAEHKQLIKDIEIKAQNEQATTNAEHKQLIYENNISKQKLTYDIEIKVISLSRCVSKFICKQQTFDQNLNIMDLDDPLQS
ncbi:Hypothetical_protein [Hexamita inflata]|uniref:Hypothetical_protein n=1 Tax=Hexamita inflata TaxID=28002 RepID=A0AA86RES4_9EUKA|nr:Hypothetical protein HINF_LOCUS59543 [Hexamita inflata]